MAVETSHLLFDYTLDYITLLHWHLNTSSFIYHVIFLYGKVLQHCVIPWMLSRLLRPCVHVS